MARIPSFVRKRPVAVFSVFIAVGALLMGVSAVSLAAIHRPIAVELVALATDSGAAVPATDAPTQSPTPSPSASRTRSAKALPSPKKSGTVKPSPRPAGVAVPPPPHPPAPAPTSPSAGASPSCPTYEGPVAAKSAVKSALVTAGSTQYWAGVAPSSLPKEVNGVAPAITIPSNLMKAIAWQESGWQSTIVACDGGIGTMQIMPGTATWANQRFGTDYDVHTLSGNTSLGGEYLEWLVMYFGLYYFGNNFDLTNTAVTNSGYTLLDAVVASYNVGAGAVGLDDGTITVPNPRYMDNVEALMTNCVCLSY
ncbi:MAG TPA: lytic transglycosylase domain-containing protein [Micromonosporaceae bacterium]